MILKKPWNKDSSLWSRREIGWWRRCDFRFPSITKVTSGIPEYGSCCKRIARRYLDPVQNRLYSRKPSSPATFRSLKRKEQRNLDEKTVICEIVEAMEYDTFTTFQDWENKTQEIIALQAKWKTIGYAPQKWTWRYSNVSVPLVMNFSNAKPSSSSPSRKVWQAIWKRRKHYVKSRSTKRKYRLESNCWYSKQITKEWKTIGPVPKSIRMPYGNDSLPHVIISSSKRTRRLLHNAQLNRKTWFRKRRSLKS